MIETAKLASPYTPTVWDNESVLPIQEAVKVDDHTEITYIGVKMALGEALKHVYHKETPGKLLTRYDLFEDIYLIDDDLVSFHGSLASFRDVLNWAYKME